MDSETFHRKVLCCNESNELTAHFLKKFQQNWKQKHLYVCVYSVHSLVHKVHISNNDFTLGKYE